MPRDPVLVRLRVAAAPKRSSVSIRAGLMPWVPFWMALGIGLWLSLPFQPGPWLHAGLAAGVIGAMFLLWLTPRLAEAGRLSWRLADWLRVLCIALVLAMSGFGLTSLRSGLVAAPVLGFRYYGPVEGRVVAIDRSARDRIRLTLDQVILEDMRPGGVPERVRVSLFQADPLPVPGQRVMLTAHLGPPPGPAEPGAFDFRRMAWFDRLGAIGYSRTPVMTVAPPKPGGALALHRLRLRLSQAMQDSIGGQAGAVSSAMMTGDRSGIAEKTNDIMRASNLYHIVSISGLHMTMLTGFVYAALRLIGAGIIGCMGLPGGGLHKFAAGGALIAAAGYLWLSGSDVATTRSFIMVAVMLVAILADRRAISLRTVAIAAIIILGLTPEALASPGFQMSFAATVALVLAAGPWQGVASRLPWWLRPVVLLVLSSTIASLATSPIAAAHFGRISHFGIFANLLVVPVIGAVVMPAGVIAAVLGLIGLHDLPLWFMGWGTRWMLFVAEFTSNLDGSMTILPAPPGIVLPTLGIGACLIALTPIGAALGARSSAVLRRIGGVAAVLAAFGIWIAHQRPAVLISAEGDAVGIMTPEGRAFSKPKGGGFAAGQWLETDGSVMDQKKSAMIPLWQGEQGARRATWETPAGGVTLYHLTGKRAAGQAQDLCRPGVIIVSNMALAKGLARRGGCTVLDAVRLRATGAVAIDPRGTPPRFLTVLDMSGNRPWLPLAASERRRNVQ